MNSADILNAIDSRRHESSRFIRWWRKENDFADFELLGDFLQRLQANEEFSGFELLDTEDMWCVLKKFAMTRVVRENRTHGDIIVWTHMDGQRQTEEELPYNDESIMTIFDIETKGDTLQ
jgi:hypothetical protein